jgi:hypothetical protein
MRIDLLMEQNPDIALAPQGGIRLDMNTVIATVYPEVYPSDMSPT